ncbi:hypothetical protein ACFSM5_06810 [Lacibacterium aquatile]|uniref:Integrase n=1 Tax=Lacibacterium aquatile TaxID=1168082 RepID=A0ABW5DNH9_9PROT
MPHDVLLSLRDRDASTNLARYINRARHEVKAFGSDLDFDAPVWDVTKDAIARVSSGKSTWKLYFSTHEGGTSQSMAGRTPMSEPFASFVKAIVRIRQEAKPKAPENHNALIRSSRYLHDTLADQGYDPTQITPAHFHSAAGACKAREAESSRYRVGLFLCEIAEVLDTFSISRTQVAFKNPFPRVVHDHTRIGKEHEMRRAEKLPGPEALDALAEIANRVTEPADIVLMRAIELLVCGGWRINELLTLPVHCEITEPAFENGQPMLDGQGNQIIRYGIRYWPEKGADPDIKWLPTPMVDLAKRAIADIRLYTDSAREVARFTEENPGRVPLPAKFDEAGSLTLREVEEILNLAPKGGLNWCRTVGIPYNDGRIKRADLEAACIARQPSLPPSSPIPLSKHLFLVHLHFLNAQKSTCPCQIDIVTDGRLNDFLQSREAGRYRIRSAFDRFGYSMPDGTPIELTSHQFRHWLNTLAQRGGMGQHVIAKWFGRKEAGQNAEYDHVSAMELAERSRTLLANGQVRGAIAEIHDRLPPTTREAFRESMLNTQHTTDIGGCINDWSLAPCPTHASCAKCNDLLVVKGDEKQRTNTETLLEEHKWMRERALVELNDGTYGASNHLAHNDAMIEGLNKALAVHDDVTIPDGTLVQINPSAPEIHGNKPLPRL